MGDYDDVAGGYDRGMRFLERLVLGRLRRSVFPELRGLVLELGAGTGVNLPLYGKAAHVVALDRSGEMLARARRRDARASVMLVRADARWLPFRDRAFAAVSGALVFCSVAAPHEALTEAHRVLQSAGRLVLLEHMRGVGLGALLTYLAQPLWGLWSNDCRLDRETVREVVSAGFSLSSVDHYALGIIRLIEARASG